MLFTVESGSVECLPLKASLFTLQHRFGCPFKIAISHVGIKTLSVIIVHYKVLLTLEQNSLLHAHCEVLPWYVDLR